MLFSKWIFHALQIRLCYSFACGLTHLHTEIKGTNSKHAIAHRDIKTRNILVKRDGTCAIADFGLAVRFEGDKNEVDYGSPNQRVGTIRYMSPEVLDQNMRAAPFQSYVRSDMYSSGLVFWEVAWRTSGPVVHNLLTEKSDLVSEDVIEKKQMVRILRSDNESRVVCSGNCYLLSCIMNCAEYISFKKVA